MLVMDTILLTGRMATPGIMLLRTRLGITLGTVTTPLVGRTAITVITPAQHDRIIITTLIRTIMFDQITTITPEPITTITPIRTITLSRITITTPEQTITTP